MQYLFSLENSLYVLVILLAFKSKLPRHYVLIYWLVSIAITFVTTINGFPGFISDFIFFAFLSFTTIFITRDIISVILISTLPLINTELDFYLQPKYISFLISESNELYPIISILISLIFVYCVTRLELRFARYLESILSFYKPLMIVSLPALFFFINNRNALGYFSSLLELELEQAQILVLPFYILPILAILVYLFLNFTLQESERVEFEKEQLKVSQTFNSMVKDQYTEMRQFRHDYRNILLTLETYIKDHDWNELTNYFHQTILPSGIHSDKASVQLSKLSNIETVGVRNLLFTKLAYATSQQIDVSVEVHKPVSLKVKKDPLYLIRIIGILMDNAIEALAEQGHGTLSVALFDDEETVQLIIANDSDQSPGPLHKLTQPGYSTKGDGRGLGLATVAELTERAHIDLLTSYHEGIFTQHLIFNKERLEP